VKLFHVIDQSGLASRSHPKGRCKYVGDGVACRLVGPRRNLASKAVAHSLQVRRYTEHCEQMVVSNKQ
jgi:hypothetical protein